MKTNTSKILTRVAFSILLASAGLSSAKKKDKAPAVALTAQGQALEKKYSDAMATLKASLASKVPNVAAQKKAAFENALKAEDQAIAAIEKAKKGQGEYNTAKALVGHAKGKWIGGANKGIAAATAKLKKAKTAAEKAAAQKELANWQQNLKDGQDALRERQARLDKAEKDRPRVLKEVKAAEDTVAKAKEKTLAAVAALGLNSALDSDKLDGPLAKYVVLLEATPRGLATFAQQSKDHEDLISKLLSADDLLVDMVQADGARDGKYGEAMKIYRDIWKASEKASQSPFRRLALAIALEHAVPVKQRNAVAKTDAPQFVDPIKRYLHYEKALIDGELDPAFKNLSTWDYRMVVNGEEPDEILAWGRKMLRNYRPDHVTTKDYRWRYVALVRSDVPYGSQDNKYDKPELQFFQNILMNGGICGRRAFIGRFILRAFGVPTTARPQRGHAALAHWTPEGWVVCLGAGWGSGWTKTRYRSDLDFLATTQARMAGDAYLKVKRAQWIGDVLGEKRVFGLNDKSTPDFWYGVSLFLQNNVIKEAKAKTLAAVGTDIGEANETKEKVEIAKVTMTNKDREVSVDATGVITIPAAATTKPTKSTGKILFLNSNLGGKQLHYSRTGGHQTFEYQFDAPAAGKYELTARVVTPSWRQNVLLMINGSKSAVDIPLPFTVGMWDTTKPVVVELKKGKNHFLFKREGGVKGITIKDFTLTPVR
jgi:hypothetical protein